MKFLISFLFLILFYFTVSKSQISIVCQACRILLGRLVDKLSEIQLGDGTPAILSTKQLLLPIRALCMGQSLLSSADEVALIAAIKNSKIPPCVKSQSPGVEKDSSQSSKDSARVRCDLSNSILEQLTMPLQDFTLSVPRVVESSNDGTSKITNDNTANEPHSDTKVCVRFQGF